jgi:putative acetyltransferase
MQSMFNITIITPSHPQVRALLTEHHHAMLQHSPLESIHALDYSALAQPDITFWGVWHNNQLAGFGALKNLTDQHAELKSMRTATPFLRQGVARLLMTFITEHALKKGYIRLSLETGTANAFLPAQKLYQQLGFNYCQPFADYKADPFSTFMSKTLP